MLLKLFRFLDRFERSKGGEVIDLYLLRLVTSRRSDEEAKRLAREADAMNRLRARKRA